MKQRKPGGKTMPDDGYASLQSHGGTDIEADPKEIVMGLHWHAPERNTADEAPPRLDALCVLFDARQRVLEVIHSGHPRNANDSVLHTGSSHPGASEWDDERIFAFLEALPETVSTLSFVVISPTGRAFRNIPGARCHVSDRVTERAWVRLELTALSNQRAHNVAMLRRTPSGWKLFPGAPAAIRNPRTPCLITAAADDKHVIRKSGPRKRGGITVGSQSNVRSLAANGEPTGQP